MADLHRWPSGLTHRKLQVILKNLPEESAWKTWVRDHVTVDNPEPDSENPFEGQGWSLLNRQVQGLRNDIHQTNFNLLRAIAALVNGGASDEEFEAPYATPHIKVNEPQPETTDDDVISLEERRRLLEQVRRNRGWRFPTS